MSNYEYENFSASLKWQNTNTNIISLSKNDQMWIQISFSSQKWPNTNTKIPSELEEAPRYKLLVTVDSVDTCILFMLLKLHYTAKTLAHMPIYDRAATVAESWVQ